MNLSRIIAIQIRETLLGVNNLFTTKTIAWICLCFDNKVVIQNILYYISIFLQPVLTIFIIVGVDTIIIWTVSADLNTETGLAHSLYPAPPDLNQNYTSLKYI